MYQLKDEQALLRISRLFNIPIEKIQPKLKFGEDLKSSFVSDFKLNEFDKILDDIHEVNNFSTIELKEEIKTVEDFCNLISQYKINNLNGFLILIKRWEKEWIINNSSFLRKFLWNLFGIYL